MSSMFNSLCRDLALTSMFVASTAVVAAAQSPGQSPRPGSVAARDTAQQPAVEAAADQAEEVARRFQLGIEGGVGLDPELVMIGVHGRLGPLFRNRIELRPGVEVGLGEVTTLLSINLDVLYSVTLASRDWSPYFGAGPAFGLSHRGFEVDEGDGDHVDVDGVAVPNRVNNRFDFSDTDFNGGMNFIAGARSQSGRFIELRTTAWGVSNIRLMAGFGF